MRSSLADALSGKLGTGEEICIKDLAGLITKLTGFEGDFVWDASNPDRGDLSRAGKAVGPHSPMFDSDPP